MGITYHGPYADEVGYDEHEGYGARIRPDGSETATWTYETRETAGYRAACTCGWRGMVQHPPTDAGDELAKDEWDGDHLQPMLRSIASRHTVTGDKLLGFIQDLRSTLKTTPESNGRMLTERSLGVVDVIASLENLLDHLATAD